MSYNPPPMSEPLTLPERAGRAAIWNVLALGTLAVLTFATGILLARTLSKEEFAAYGTFIALVAGILCAVDLGLSASVPKFAAAAAKEGGRRGLLRLLLLMASLKLLLLGVVAIPVLVATEPVARFLGIPATVPPRFLMAVILVVWLDLLSDISQQGLATIFAQGTLSTIRVLESLTLSGLLIAFALAGKGVHGVLWAFTGASAFKLALSGVGLGLRLRSMPAGAEIPIVPIVPRLARHAATFYAAKWTAYLAGPAFATIVLRATSSSDTVAHFTLAGDLVFRALELATSPVNSLLLPIFAHLVLLEDRAPVRRAFSVLTKVYAFALVPSAVGLVVLAPALFTVLYTANYADAVPFFQVLVGLIFLEMVFYPVASSSMITTERYGAFLTSRLPIVVAAALAPTIVREAGPLAAVWLLAGSRVVSVALLLGAARHLLEAVVPAGYLLRQAVLAALLAVPLWALTRSIEPTPVVVAGAVLGYAVLFLVASKVTGGIGEETRAAIAEMRLPFKRVLLWLF